MRAVGHLTVSREEIHNYVAAFIVCVSLLFAHAQCWGFRFPYTSRDAQTHIASHDMQTQHPRSGSTHAHKRLYGLGFTA